MRQPRTLVSALAAMAVGALVLVPVMSDASSPAEGRVDRVVAAGDSWTDIANEIAPAASAADRATFARTLARRNALDANPDNDSLTANLAVGRLVSYLPGDVPSAAPATTTTEVPTSTSTSTTIAASTTTAGATTTTVAPTTSSTAAPTTTSAPTTSTGPSTTSPGTSGCGLSAAAFCETFSQAYPDSVSRTGDLDETVWGVSRAHNQGSIGPFQWYRSTQVVNGCAIGQAPNDVRVCNGRLIEGVSDGGNDSKTTLAMYPKQPFNWAGRTGNIVFDLSADSEGNHAAWPELWVTDKPVPAPGNDGNSTPHNGFGISFDGQAGDSHLPGRMVLVVNGVRTEVDGVIDWNSFPSNEQRRDSNGQPSHADSAKLDHFRIAVSQNKVQAFATFPAGPTPTHEYLISTWNVNLDPSFTQGLVWMNDAHYNACKLDNQCDHAFAWDNFGFDGPKTYRDLSFDALDRMTPAPPGENGEPGVFLGWDAVTPQAIIVNGVHLGDKTPTAAYALFNSYSLGSPQYAKVSLNGGPAITTAWDHAANEAYTVYTLAVPIPLDQIHTDGTPNTLTFTATDHVYVANVNIVLVNAQTVP